MYVTSNSSRVHKSNQKCHDENKKREEEFEKKSSLMCQLGIIPNENIDKTGLPDYLAIALNWYAAYDRSGESFALLNYQHLIRVAQEFDMCYVEDNITMEEFLDNG